MDRYKRYTPRTYPCPQGARERMNTEQNYCVCSSQPISLAMAYIPVQTWQETYRPCEALDRGTLFPDLYKPYAMGGCRR